MFRSREMTFWLEQAEAELAQMRELTYANAMADPVRTRLDPRQIEIVDQDVATVLRAKSGMERLRLAHEAWELARDRLTAFFSARRPEWAPEEVQRQDAILRQTTDG